MSRCSPTRRGRPRHDTHRHRRRRHQYRRSPDRGPTVLHAVKTGTTEDVLGGIQTALALLLGKASADQAARIGAVMIGTTHFTNAVVQRRHLQKVGGIAHRPACQRQPAAVRRLAGRPRGRCQRRGLHGRAAGTNMTAGRSCRSTAPQCAMPPGGSPMPDYGRLRCPRVLAARPFLRGRRGGDLAGGNARRADHPVARAWPHRPAGARERGVAECLSTRPCRHDRRGVRGGDRTERHRRSAVI